MKRILSTIAAAVLAAALIIQMSGCSVTVRIYGKSIDALSDIDLGYGRVYLSQVMNALTTDDLQTVNDLGYHAGLEDAETFIRKNVSALEPWLETAERAGVVILSENLLWGASKDPRNIASLVREVNSPYFGWCFDTGHANCFGIRPEILAECAVVPQSLHMQDNQGDGWDAHLIPGEGTIDWDALIRTLREIGYAGDCVLEAHHQSLDAPDHARDAILTRLLAAARILREKMEA